MPAENRFGVSLSLPAMLDGAIDRRTDRAGARFRFADSHSTGIGLAARRGTLSSNPSCPRIQSALWFPQSNLKSRPRGGECGPSCSPSVGRSDAYGPLQQALEMLAASDIPGSANDVLDPDTACPSQQIPSPRPPLFEETDASLWDRDKLQANCGEGGPPAGGDTVSTSNEARSGVRRLFTCVPSTTALSMFPRAHILRSTAGR
jgi:hypothetical protein